jgi:hypothetical protein
MGSASLAPIGAYWLVMLVVADALDVPALPHQAVCVASLGAAVLAGTAEAHLYLGSALVPSFEAIPTRDDWYTPWGAPPDVRSLAVAADGTVFVNVHVGGVWRAASLEGPWAEVVPVDDDTHQVVAGASGVVVVAAAVGFGWSFDGGRSFEWTTACLHASYCRAVAIAGDWALVTASDGPFTKQGAVYRRPLRSTDPFERCTEFFSFNIDTGQLAASGDEAAFGTDDGRVFVSSDAGATWSLAESGRAAVRSVAFTAAPA